MFVQSSRSCTLCKSEGPMPVRAATNADASSARKALQAADNLAAALLGTGSALGCRVGKLDGRGCWGAFGGGGGGRPEFAWSRARCCWAWICAGSTACPSPRRGARDCLRRHRRDAMSSARWRDLDARKRVASMVRRHQQDAGRRRARARPRSAGGPARRGVVRQCATARGRDGTSRGRRRAAPRRGPASAAGGALY